MRASIDVTAAAQNIKLPHAGTQVRSGSLRAGHFATPWLRPEVIFFGTHTPQVLLLLKGRFEVLSFEVVF